MSVPPCVGGRTAEISDEREKIRQANRNGEGTKHRSRESEATREEDRGSEEVA